MEKDTEVLSEKRKQIGSWSLGSCLGQGGMSVVYEATHVQTGQEAAIKILKFTEDIPEEVVDRFFHELHISRRLKHPHIIEIYAFGFEQALGFYLVMEHLQGQNLHEYMASFKRELTLNEAYTITSQICDAMEFAHQRDIIHRDLKPENIYLCGQPGELEQVKVLDFGIAQFQLGENNRLTQSGTTLGTPHYLSPEQARGEPVHAASDIYSLTVILFELLTRSNLFVADSPLQYMMRHAYTEPPCLAQARPDLFFPQALEELIRTGLAKQPDERISSMGKLKKSLHECITGVESTKSTSEVTAFSPQVESIGSYQMKPAVSREASDPQMRPVRIGGRKEEQKNAKSDEPKSKALVRTALRGSLIWSNPWVIGVLSLFVVSMTFTFAFRGVRKQKQISQKESKEIVQLWKQLEHLPRTTHAFRLQMQRNSVVPKRSGIDKHKTRQDAGRAKKKKWMQLIQKKLNRSEPTSDVEPSNLDAGIQKDSRSKSE